MKWFKLVLSVSIVTLFFSCAKKEEDLEQPIADMADAPGEDVSTVPPALESLTITPIYFGFDEYSLSSEAQDRLSMAAEALNESSSASILVAGHCDERGSEEYNLALGRKRAEAVKDYLTQLGVSDSQISVTSYGEQRPVAEGHNEEAWALNRRAEFEVSGL